MSKLQTDGVHGGSIGRAFPAPFGAIGVVAVVGLVLFGALSIRPLMGGQPAPTGPVSATSTEGSYELTIRSEHGMYAASESVIVNASLMYRGPDPQVTVTHGLDGPVFFGVTEPVSGFRLSPIVAESCNGSTLSRNVPVDVAFRKSGSSIDQNTPLSAANAFFMDPVLRLPAGTWHVYAVADFQIGQCGVGAQTYNVRAEITIAVPDASGSIPTAVPPTPTADPLDLPVGDDTQDGSVQLTLTSPHGRYKAGDPIEVVAGLTNGGSGASITTYGGSDGPVIFWLRQVDGPVVIDPIVLMDCTNQVTLPPNEPLQIPFKTKTGTVPSGAPNPEYWQSWFRDPVLRLPTGTWEISATPNFTLGGCGSKTSPNLRPTITLVVTP